MVRPSTGVPTSTRWLQACSNPLRGGCRFSPGANGIGSAQVVRRPRIPRPRRFRDPGTAFATVGPGAGRGSRQSTVIGRGIPGSAGRVSCPGKRRDRPAAHRPRKGPPEAYSRRRRRVGCRCDTPVNSGFAGVRFAQSGGGGLHQRDRKPRSCGVRRPARDVVYRQPRASGNDPGDRSHGRAPDPPSLGASGPETPPERLADLARETRAGTVVAGSFFERGNQLEVSVEVSDARNGELRSAIGPVRGSQAGMDRLVETVGGQVVRAVSSLLDQPRPPGSTESGPSAGPSESAIELMPARQPKQCLCPCGALRC